MERGVGVAAKLKCVREKREMVKRMKLSVQKMEAAILILCGLGVPFLEGGWEHACKY